MSGPLHDIEKTRKVDENGERNLPKYENNIKYIEEYDLPKAIEKSEIQSNNLLKFTYL